MTRSHHEPVDLAAAPEPFSYNPSSWSQRVRISLVAGVAAFIATYRALYQWRLIGDVWDLVFGEQFRRVLDSDVSHTMRRWVRIPDSALRALAYLGDISGSASSNSCSRAGWPSALFPRSHAPRGNGPPTLRVDVDKLAVCRYVR